MAGHVKEAWPELLHSSVDDARIALNNSGVVENVYVQPPSPGTRPANLGGAKDVWLYTDGNDVVYEIPKLGAWHPNRKSFLHLPVLKCQSQTQLFQKYCRVYKHIHEVQNVYMSFIRSFPRLSGSGTQKSSQIIEFSFSLLIQVRKKCGLCTKLYISFSTKLSTTNVPFSANLVKILVK